MQTSEWRVRISLPGKAFSGALQSDVRWPDQAAAWTGLACAEPLNDSYLPAQLVCVLSTAWNRAQICQSLSTLSRHPLPPTSSSTAHPSTTTLCLRLYYRRPRFALLTNLWSVGVNLSFGRRFKYINMWKIIENILRNLLVWSFSPKFRILKSKSVVFLNHFRDLSRDKICLYVCVYI